jgi:Ca2+/Na+ antiporter
MTQKNKYLINKLEILQKKSQETFKKQSMYLSLSSIFFVLTFLALFFAQGTNWLFLSFIPALLLVIFIFLYNQYSVKYKKEFKKEFVSELFSQILPNSNYYPDKGFSKEVLFQNGSGIFDFKLHTFKSEDLITAQIQDWKLEISEIASQYKSGKYLRKLFNGIAIKITLPISFNHDLIIQDKNFQQKADHGLENKVKLESLVWEKTFLTYCQDQVFARYILNTAVMQRILDIHSKYTNYLNNNKLALSFTKNHIYIFWDNENNFWEPKYSLQNETELRFSIRQYINDWEFVIGLVKDLQIGREIWSRKNFISN